MHWIRTLLVVLAGAVLLAAPSALAASPDLVVAQIYGGGGNSGATYQNDFVELFNRGGSTVNLTGWTVQYAAASSTSWSTTSLSGTIPAGGHYLVQLASAGSVGLSLPTPDATGTTNLAASGGKIAIVHDTTPLSCGSSAGSCSAIAAVRDLVGYGSATDYEGSGAAPALSATEAAIRAGSGCTDTDVSSDDFAAASPAPHNSSWAAGSCGSSSSPGASQSASVAVDVQSVLAVSLEKTALSFGSAAVGQMPAPVGEKVTVTSTGANGYSLSVHRTHVQPGRPAARDRRHRRDRRAAELRARRRGARSGADHARSGPPDRHDIGSERGQRRSVADERRLRLASPGGACRPLQLDDHLHGDRQVSIAYLVGAVALAAAPTHPLFSVSPAHVVLAPGAHATVAVATGTARNLAIAAEVGGLTLDARGRPRLVRPGDAAPWLKLSASMLRAVHGRTQLTISVRRVAGAAPGDHRAVVLLTATQPGSSGVLVRMRLDSSSRCACRARSCTG